MAWTSVTSNLRCSPDGRVRERSSCERRPAIERGAARRVSMRSPDLSRQEPGGKYLQPDLRLRTRTLSRHLACARAATSFMRSGLDGSFRSSAPAETGHSLRDDVPDERLRIDTSSGKGLADSTLHAKGRQSCHCSPLHRRRQEPFPRPARSQAVRRRERTPCQSFLPSSPRQPRTSFKPSSTCLMTASET